MVPRGARILVVFLIVLAVVIGASAFVVSETDQVIITQLGRPIGQPITAAGLHFKIPFIQTANFFEKRIMKWDGSPNQIPTKDKKYIWVDSTARWRIKDPLLFLMRVGSIGTANSRLDGIIDSVVRDHVSNNDLVELVRSEGWAEAKQKLQEAGIPDIQFLSPFESSEESDHLQKGREKITREMVADASRVLPEFGIEIHDIRIKRINYVESVQQKVFERMISERKRIAAQYRSEGEGERAATLGQMDREMSKITSEAYRKAQEVRGKADAEATRIYADAFGKDPEFFALYRTLELYRNFPANSSFMLSTDADIFKYLKGSRDIPRK
ncbi:MAG: protease modulator HflC [Desulfobacteraceae bacterium]|nr:protease modulator HflC [Desulfobacteraceae bacterium]